MLTLVSYKSHTGIPITISYLCLLCLICVLILRNMLRMEDPETARSSFFPRPGPDE